MSIDDYLFTTPIADLCSVLQHSRGYRRSVESGYYLTVGRQFEQAEAVLNNDS